MISLLLLLIPLFFVMYVVYKGMNPPLAMILAAIIACIVSGMNSF